MSLLRIFSRRVTQTAQAAKQVLAPEISALPIFHAQQADSPVSKLNHDFEASGVCIRAFLGNPGRLHTANQVERFLGRSELHQLVGSFFSHSVEGSASILMKDGRQMPYNGVFFCVPEPRVMGIETRKYGFDDFKGFTLVERVFSDTAGLQRLVEHIKEKKKLPVMRPLHHLHELIIRYAAGNVSAVGISADHVLKDPVGRTKQLDAWIAGLRPEDLDVIREEHGEDKEVSQPIHKEGVYTALYTVAALRARGYDVPLVLFDGDEFVEATIPDDVLEVAERHYEENRYSYEGMGLEFRQVLKSLITLMFVLYAIKDTLSWLQEEKGEDFQVAFDRVCASENLDAATKASLKEMISLIAELPKDALAHNTEGLSKILDFLASKDAKNLDKLKVATRILGESLVMYCSLSINNVLCAKTPLRVAAKGPLNLFLFMLLLEAGHGHQLKADEAGADA